MLRDNPVFSLVHEFGPRAGETVVGLASYGGRLFLATDKALYDLNVSDWIRQKQAELIAATEARQQGK